MKRVAMIIGIVGIAMILLGIAIQYTKIKCDVIDKNTDFWVRNCDYK